MKFIHTADVHLGALPDKGRPWAEERKEEIWETFHKIIRMANRERADLLLIAGDLFHHQPSVRELKEVNALFRQLTGTQVALIAGNHDFLQADSVYRTFAWEENVAFLNGRECEAVYFEELETTVYGFSYYCQEITEPLYDRLAPDGGEGCHILLAHGGDAQHIPFDRSCLLKSGFDYIALGHIHKPGYLAPNMVYAGAPEPIDPNDMGQHGVILGEYKNKEIRTRFVPMACREYISLAVPCDQGSTDRDMRERIRNALEEHGRGNIYRITVEGYRDADIVFDTARWRELGNILEIRDQSEPDYDFESLLAAHGQDVIGRCIRKLLPRPGESKEQESIRRQALYAVTAALNGRR